MVKEIIKDTLLLSKKSIPATAADQQIVTDLLDTLKAHENHCVGLAANMIGESKTIIVIKIGEFFLPMINPVIIKKSAKTYTAAESCLSLSGERTVARYESIEVKYRDQQFKKQKQKFSGFTAEIIQHEIDHCNGILI